MRGMLTLLVTAVSVALLACDVAAAANPVAANFESFNLGSVNGQAGWKSAGAFDQEVVRNAGTVPAAFALQSLRMSNAVTSGSFADQTFSTPVTPPAGEGEPNSRFIARFSFISTSPGSEQPGLAMTVSPDSYEGSRSSWISLKDTSDGIAAKIRDTPEVDGDFVEHDALVWPRSVPHTVEFLVKVNPGDDNDLVQVSIDGIVVSPPCFTTWENYYRVAPEQAGNGNLPPIINSLEFRLGGTAAPALAGHGFLFDNVTVQTDDGPGPTGCPASGTAPPDNIDIGKKALTKFVAPGHLARYRITVRNRGRAPVVGLRACDRAPRALRFVRARPRLVRASGRRLCLTMRRLRPGQRKTIRATFRLRAGVTADTVTNGAIADAPIGSRPAPPVQPSGAGARAPRRRRVARTAETIGVLKACGASANPRAHAAC